MNIDDQIRDLCRQNTADVLDAVDHKYNNYRIGGPQERDYDLTNHPVIAEIARRNPRGPGKLRTNFPPSNRPGWS